MTTINFMAPAARYSLEEEETRILNASAKCIRESSLLDFKMSAIAKEAGISVGSVYKHVRSKEDVLVALAIKAAEFTQSIINKVLNAPMTAPQRLLSPLLLDPKKIYEEPFGMHLEMLISNEALLKKASPQWVEKLYVADRQMQQIFFEALVGDELDAEGEHRETLVEELMVGLWSMHVGFIQVALHRSAIRPDESPNSLPFPLPVDHSLVNNAFMLINGYPWKKPLTTDGIETASKMLMELGFR
jgi:AcrR family transcriptional regulator